eukprot:TRINITY_DN19699_c0_g1_i5.p5 TRINITY_DN19699_c0_g1~~TRINITY_DN19699_c0_g1_i5.p5  ORF type:complete len:113 (+),score=30.57 TRINITY_DN19699_c0_g1_i5:358-696(+)
MFLSHPEERIKFATKVACGSQAAAGPRLVAAPGAPLFPLRRNPRSPRSAEASEALEMVLGIAQLQRPRAKVVRYAPQPEYSGDAHPSVMAGIVQETVDKFNRQIIRHDMLHS